MSRLVLLGAAQVIDARHALAPRARRRGYEEWAYFVVCMLFPLLGLQLPPWHSGPPATLLVGVIVLLLAACASVMLLANMRPGKVAESNSNTASTELSGHLAGWRGSATSSADDKVAEPNGTPPRGGQNGSAGAAQRGATGVSVHKKCPGFAGPS